ncbi:MAG: threonine transporter RhtB [Desulfuromonas sp.]|nr:MAG: threonine transporter RhtB [Desulfuromonas sp.]
MLLPLDTALTFFGAATLLALAPGPDNLFVLAQSSLYGPRAGMSITLGLCTGLIGHTLAVICGVALLFQVSIMAFTLLKVAGAGYLLYLAYQTLRAPTLTSQRQQETVPLRRLYRRGILMNLGNPKVSLFFLSFLPQFSDPQRGPVAPQLLQLGLLFMLAALIIFSIIALLAGHLSRLLETRPTLQGGMKNLTALLFVGLALKLVGNRA